MNAASSVMKNWRRKQTTKAEIIVNDVPDALQRIFVQTLGEVWLQAQKLASEALSAAQMRWEVERQDSDLTKQNKDAVLSVQNAVYKQELLRKELVATKEQLAEKNGELKVYKSQLGKVR